MKHRMIGASATLALALGGLSAAAIPASATQHVAVTTSTTINGNGWAPNAQGPGSGSITGVVGPNAETAAKFTTQGDGTIETLFGTSYIGTQFADVSGLSYDTYVQHSNSSLLAPSIGFEVWGGTNYAFLGSMVYEPYVADASQPVTQGQWQHWNATAPDALWWSTKAIFNPDGSVLWPAQQAHTLAEFEAAFAAYPAKYGNLMTKDGVKTYVGESTSTTDWDGFVAYVDNVHVTTSTSDTNWDFTTGIGPCVASEDDNAMVYTLTQDCSTVATINVPDGWTVDGAGHRLTAVEDAAHPNFPGAVLLSATGDGTGPAEMNVANLDIETQGFQNGQNSGGQLAGIKFDRAGGSVENVQINGISHGNGVQEGIALWVRNRDASGGYQAPLAKVTVDQVSVKNYQKSGVIFDGNVDFKLTNSTIGSAAGPDGTPLTSIAANSIQVSRDAKGTISDNTIGLNEYNPSPPPGDGSDATAILMYNTLTVSITRNVITGGNGDVGLDVYNDTNSVLPSVANVSCNVFSRSESGDPTDPYGVGIAQWNDGSDPVTVNLSDSTFRGWKHDTATISFNGSTPVFGPGAQNAEQDQCAPTKPTNVTVPGGDQQTDVTWSASTGFPYAPLLGYTVTATDENDNPVASQTVGPNATSAHLNGLTSGQDYTITVVANGGGGNSAPASTVLYATHLTVSVGSGTIVYGKSTTLSGTLSTDAPGGTVNGRLVTIQRSPAGANTWTLATTKTVGPDGTFSATIIPKANTDYRAVYAGGPDNSSVSAVSTVNVAMKVKVRVSSKKGHVGKTFKLNGVVSPDHSGLPVDLQQKINGVWTTIDTKVLDGQSSYGFKFQPQTPDVYLLRVYSQGDATHVAGTSPSVSIAVK